MQKIKNAGDFGLGFNCMTRLYMNGYNEEILHDMIKVCEEYLKYLISAICLIRRIWRNFDSAYRSIYMLTLQLM